MSSTSSTSIDYTRESKHNPHSKSKSKSHSKPKFKSLDSSHPTDSPPPDSAENDSSETAIDLAEFEGDDEFAPFSGFARDPSTIERFFTHRYLSHMGKGEDLYLQCHDCGIMVMGLAANHPIRRL